MLYSGAFALQPFWVWLLCWGPRMIWIRITVLPGARGGLPWPVAVVEEPRQSTSPTIRSCTP